MICYKLGDKVVQGDEENSLYTYRIASNGVFLEAERPELKIRMQLGEAEVRGLGDPFVQKNPYYQENQKFNWWLDCGNAEESGQVIFGAETDPARFVRDVFGADGKICRRLPAPSLVEPLLLEASAAEQQPKKQGCADIQIHNDQSLSVNQMVAAIAGDYLLRIVTGTLKKYATYFDLSSGVMRSKYITRDNLRQYRPSQGDSSQ